MKQVQRIFIVGHHGAGKGLLAKTVAQSLGWRFVDADLGLESHVGRHVNEILLRTPQIFKHVIKYNNVCLINIKYRIRNL